MIGIKLYANGKVAKYEIPKADENYIALQLAIDCECIDIIHARHLKEPYCMVVDDEGLLVDSPKVNIVASYLYGFLDHGQPIMGDVLIMKDEYTPDGIETVGLSEDDLKYLMEFLRCGETFNGVFLTGDTMLNRFSGFTL